MLERYTDRARRSIVLAHDAARSLNHNYVGTEHLIIGLIGEGGGVAFRALDALGVTEAAVREAVEKYAMPGQHPPAGHLPFTQRLKKVCELAFRESLQCGCNYIATEHLLLGLLREGDGTGVKALADCGVAEGDTGFLADVRAKVLDLLRGYAEQRKAEPKPPLSSLPWRTGSRNDRTIYAVLDSGDHLEDVFIGTLDTAELAAEAVRAHNYGRACDKVTRDILEALCERDGIPVESSVTPGAVARNYELALRLRIGQVFGISND